MSKARQPTLPGFEEATDAPQPEPPAAAPSPQGFTDLDGQTVYVVDSHALIYQLFHAMPEMTGPSGQPVGAIHGFARDMLDLMDKRRPDFLICAFDHSEITFRNEIFPEYKMHRDPMPDDLRSQIPEIQRMLHAMHIPVLSIPGYEADDIMATIGHVTETLGGRCVLVTSDKDCRQLITSNVKMYNIRRNQIIDENFVVNDWGVRPDQVVDMQAMWGDSTDNVPGVPKIGAKTAANLLNAHGTLDNILAATDEMKKSKVRENLIEFREQALMSRELVRLKTDVPLEIDWATARVGGMDLPAIGELCAEFGFRRLAEMIGGMTVAEAPETWTADYQLIESLTDLESLVAQIRQAKRVSLDTETTSTSPRFAELVGYSFAVNEAEAFYVAVRGPEGDTVLDADAVRAILQPVIEDASIEKIGQNLKYDQIVLRNAGMRLAGIAFDTMVADYLLDPGERVHSIDDMAKRYFNHKTIKISSLIGTGKKQKRMDEVPVPLVADYAAEDADIPLRLTQPLQQRLQEEELLELYHELELPLIEVLAELEFNGIRVNTERLAELSARYGEELASLQTQIFAAAGKEFNIDSPKQLAGVLFDDLELPVIKKTKTGPSTDMEVLSELANHHELPALMMEYRHFAKLKSTYVDALPQLVHPETQRVHTSFRQDVAATGRLSSTEPNLQNIPVRDTRGKEIRSAFVPGEPGWKLVTFDYSQIELRVLAHFSGDDALRQAFADDVDIHALVASEVYSVPLEEITVEMRRTAKAVNFGVIYGQSAFGLAKALDIPQEEAANFIDAYFAKYPQVDKFMEDLLEGCRQKGYVSTSLGRRRSVQGVRDSSRRQSSRQRTLPERIAVNTVIQGSAADLIKQAMIAVHGRLQREGLQARMLLQIHDELVFESPSNELSQLIDLVTQEMTGVSHIDVPLKVDVKSGDNWAECEAVT